MSIGILNLGATANDGNGDPLRDGGRKLNNKMTALSRTTDGPSATATLGNIYVVPASATGAFSGQDGDIAYYNGSAWEFYSPSEGWRVWLADEKLLLVFTNSSWSDNSIGGATASAAFNVLSYGRAYLTTDDTTVNFTTASTLAFDAVTEEGGTFWSAGNPTRLMVPAGVSHVKLKAQVSFVNMSADSNVRLYVFKNGAIFDGFSAVWNEGDDTAGAHQVQLTSPILPVEGGTDYFELYVGIPSDSSVTVQSSNQRTWFEMEAVSVGAGSVRYSRVGLTGNQLTQDFSGAGQIAWDEVTEKNTSGTWVIGNPTRMVVPEGATNVRLKAQVGFQLVAANADVRLLFSSTISGDPIPFSTSHHQVAGSTIEYQISSPILEVTPGDYFELTVIIPADSSVTVVGDARTWFEMEIVEGGAGGGGGGSSTLTALTDVDADEPALVDINRVFGVKSDGVGGAEFGLLGTLNVNPLGGGVEELISEVNLSSSPTDHIDIPNTNQFSKVVIEGWGVNNPASLYLQFSDDNGATAETHNHRIGSFADTTGGGAFGNFTSTSADELFVLSVQTDGYFRLEIDGLDLNNGRFTVKRWAWASGPYAVHTFSMHEISDINTLMLDTASNMTSGRIKAWGIKNNVQPMIQDYAYSGTPGGAITLARKIAPIDISFAPGASGQFKVGSNPSGTETVDINVEGSPVGTISITSGGVATVNFTVQTDVDAGEEITLTTDGSRTFTDLYGAFWATVRA